ncbi:sensor histidine kinase [Anaerocolumna jejuensis]|uniref:sensor histidine kinase n=1 Tax=Anaerocolumna jejuensis TaxID=259063 RepID=UPI003F7B3BFA
MKMKVIKKVHIPTKSIRFRIIFVVFSIVFVLLLILLFSNIYAINVVRKQAAGTNQKMLKMYMNRVDDVFKNVENYWVGLQLSENMATIEYTDNEVNYYTAQARMKRDMENVLPTYGFIDNLFVYFSGKDTFIDAVKFDISGREQKYIRKMIKTAVEDETTLLNNKGKWFGMEVNGDYYLVRILRVNNIYMGGCAKVDKLVQKFRSDGFGEMEYITFCDNSGKEYGNSLMEFKSLLLNDQNKPYNIVGEGKKFLLLSANSKCGNYSMVALIRDNNILEGLASIQHFIRLLYLFQVIFLMVFILAMRNWIIKPMDLLIRAMKSLGSGNLEVRLKSNKVCDEYIILNNTFDTMSEQIKSLKIDIYEEKEQRQKAELQYLKLQVNPHFYINCLNVIHNLSLMEKNNLVQEMTTYLGNHLRYTMEGNSLDCLYKEINYVKNYLRIQELRFLNSIVCSFDIDNSTLDVMVPPLIIQTFIENTVKYQVVAGEITEIFIKVNSCIYKDTPFISIEVWDSGEGYPDHILDYLKNKKRIFDEKGEHFGIYNVRQRLNLIYQDMAIISFANHELTGGAYVKILIPQKI